MPTDPHTTDRAQIAALGQQPAQALHTSSAALQQQLHASQQHAQQLQAQLAQARAQLAQLHAQQRLQRWHRKRARRQQLLRRSA